MEDVLTKQQGQALLQSDREELKYVLRLHDTQRQRGFNRTGRN